MNDPNQHEHGEEAVPRPFLHGTLTLSRSSHLTLSRPNHDGKVIPCCMRTIKKAGHDERSECGLTEKWAIRLYSSR